MLLALELLFIGLVIVDTVMSYKAIKLGCKEIAFARYYIKHPVLTVAITTVGVAIIVLLAELSGFWLPLAGATIAFGYAVYNNWRVLHGR